MLAPSDPFQSFADKVWERAQKVGGLSAEDECRGVLWCRAQGDIDCAEGWRRMAAMERGFNVRWSAWCRMHMNDTIPTVAMMALLRSVAEHDATAACRLYRVEPTLTAAEDRLLYEAFTKRSDGNLRAMQRKFQRGEIARAKAG